VQVATDASGREMKAADLWQIFADTYLTDQEALGYVEHHLFEHGPQQGISLSVIRDGDRQTVRGVGNGPIDAALHALMPEANLLSYEEHSMGQGSDAQAVAFIELASDQVPGGVFGAGIDSNIVTASIRAIVSAVHQLMKSAPAVMTAQHESA